MPTISDYKDSIASLIALTPPDVIGQLREKDKADERVPAFFRAATVRNVSLYLSAVTIGELHRGVELIRYRGDARQAHTLASDAM